VANYEPLKINRSFAASRQAVWDAWTKPEQFKQWYMPAPFSVSSCEFDLRPSGQLKVQTKGPDGLIMSLIGEFKVVEVLDKLVMTNSPLDDNGNKLFEVQHSILFSGIDGNTSIDITSEVLSAGANAEPFLSGMKPGLEQALDQLALLVA
jgi:uncharacterized protein YndB with AHSA1/START domain